MTTAHRPTFHAVMGGSQQSGNLLQAPTFVQRDRDMPQQLTLKPRGDLQGALGEKYKKRTREDFRRDFKDDDKDKKPKEEFKGLADLECENAFPEDADNDFAKPPEKKAKWDEDSDDDDDVGKTKKKDDEDDSDSDSDSDQEELMRELEKIKREREEVQKQKEEEEAKEQEELRNADMAKNNPLLNSTSSDADFTLKRRWDDDTVFKNQSRTKPKHERRFINDMVRSDFHKKFMEKFMQT